MGFEAEGFRGRLRHGYGHCRTCVDGLEENFLYKHSNCWICGQWVEARILKLVRRKLKGERLQTPMSELQFF